MAPKIGPAAIRDAIAEHAQHHAAHASDAAAAAETHYAAIQADRAAAAAQRPDQPRDDGNEG